MQYLPEDLRFDPEITPTMIFRTMLPKARLAEAVELAERIELDVKKPYGRLSTGNRRKTSLIMAEFSVKPDAGNILLLDEPFSGLDAFARQAFEETNLRVQHVLTAETPGGDLRADSSTLPVNQLDAAGAPRPAGLNTIESIQIQPSIK